MKCLGTGLLSVHGRGLAALERALQRGAALPDRTGPFPVYRVPDAALKDPAVLRAARRADRFSKMAVLAACDAAAEDARPLDPLRTGLLVGTAFGPHNTTFGFLDEILEFGDGGVSPTRFSHSVHNLAAGYIAMALDLQGPALTLTRFDNPFAQVLQTAQIWLEQGVCDEVIAGCVEEAGAVLEYICSQKLAAADSAQEMRPFFDRLGPAVIAGEGAVFFRLARTGASPLEMGMGTADAPTPDGVLACFEQTEPPTCSVPAGCVSPVFGMSPIGPAFSCAAAGWMLQGGSVYGLERLPGSPPFVTAGERLKRIRCTTREPREWIDVVRRSGRSNGAAGA